MKAQGSDSNRATPPPGHAAGGDSPRTGRHRDERRFRNIATVLVVGYLSYYLFLSLGVSIGSAVDGVPDDAFYYLQVARNIAMGNGSTFDGVELTNGYHPLWLIVLIPIYLVFGGDSETGMRAALVLSSLLAVGSLVFLRRIAVRNLGGFGAVVALLIVAWPRFFGQTLNLLETGLLLLLYLVVIAMLDYFDGGPILARHRELLLGLAVGLACLARLDTVFLLFAFAIVGLRAAFLRSNPFQTPKAYALRAWQQVRWLIVPVLVVLPYLAWNLEAFGHLQPVSGAMKSSFPDLRPTFRYVTEYPDFLVLFLIGIGYAVRLLRSGRAPWQSGGPGPLARALGVFGLAAVFHMVYTVCFMQWGVDRWHYGLLLPIGILGLPQLLLWMLDRFVSGRRQAQQVKRVIRWGLLALGVPVAVALLAYSYRLREGRYLDEGREMAYWAHANLPEDAVFATTDAGVFGYFSRRTTINLDGLINSYDYREALREGRFQEYLRERGVRFIVDQYSAGNPDWVAGDYEARPYRVWFHPEHRVAGEITLFRRDEVYREQVEVRTSLASDERAPNALVIWRYRPDAQETGGRGTPGSVH